MCALGGMVDHLPQLVEGRQKKIGDLGVRRHFLRPDHVEHGFGSMREVLDRCQAEVAAGALDGMGRPKDLIHQLGIDIRSTLLDGKQVGLDRRKVFSRLVNELPQQLIIQIQARICSHVGSPIPMPC